MKKLRTLFIVGTALCAALLTTISAAASTSTVIKAKGINVTLDGYIDFLEGPLLYQDLVWYQGWLFGSDRSLVVDKGDTSVYITPGTNKKTLSPFYLNSSVTYVVRNEVKCGMGGSYGKLFMKCADVSDTIIAY